MGAGATSDSFPGYWDPVLHIELPCPALVQVEVSSLTAIGYTKFGISLASLLSSGEKWRMSAWGGAEGRWGNWEDRREGKL